MKVVVSVSRDRAEFVRVKEMYSWVSSAYKWYLREFFEITEPRGVVYRVKSSGPSTEPWGTPCQGWVPVLSTTHSFKEIFLMTHYCELLYHLTLFVYMIAD